VGKSPKAANNPHHAAPNDIIEPKALGRTLHSKIEEAQFHL
jgi:hypothetical protein